MEKREDAVRQELAERLEFPCMLLFGGSGRNTGKTELAVRMIHAWAAVQPVVAIKVITVHNRGDVCPRGGKGCGICKGLLGNYDIRQETEDGEKDTMRFRAAGAKTVYLVRAYPDSLREAMQEVLSLISEDSMVICESNSVASVVKPCAFFLVSDTHVSWKKSALAVKELADHIVETGDESFDWVEKHYGPEKKG